MLAEGDVVDGIWVVQARLGSGAMGSVFATRHATEDRVRAAVKLLDPAMLHSEEARMRFAREGEVLTRVRHPNVVRVRGMRLDTERPYLEMELVQGRPLADVIDDGAVPAAKALDWVEQLVDGVAHLHGLHIGHRDIKPSNILVQDDGTLKLVDFGLAVQLDRERVTEMGMRFGTASYAPPEWMTEGRPDPEAWDVYACGVVLYELLTGAWGFPPPPGASTRQAAMEVMLDKRRVEVLDPGPGHADAVRELVRDLTRRDAEERITSADRALLRIRQVRFGRGELREDPSIGALMHDLRTPPAAPSKPQARAPVRRRPWWQDRRVQLAVAGYAVAVVFSALGGAWLALH